ncbi:MAG: YqgE/AlgH family protein [Pirellulaceae bacterium]
MDNRITGNLLIASPALDGTAFQRSVCLVLHHDSDQVIGAVLNRPLIGHVKLNEGSAPAMTLKQSLHLGGPNVGPVFALHNCADLAEAETGVGLYMASNRKHVQRLLSDSSLNCRLIVGHVQWSVEELHAQLNDGLWRVLPATPAMVFEPDDEMWVDLARKANSLHLAHMVGAKHVPRHPALN